jgi:hypothetical protein
MSFTEQAALAADTSFQNRVRVAMTVAAVDVMGEAKGQMTDSVYNKRQSFAYQVLSSSAGYLERFTWGVVANVAITGASTDGDIQFTVNSLWNDLSGVTITD